MAICCCELCDARSRIYQFPPNWYRMAAHSARNFSIDRHRFPFDRYASNAAHMRRSLLRANSAWIVLFWLFEFFFALHARAFWTRRNKSKMSKQSTASDLLATIWMDTTTTPFSPTALLCALCFHLAIVSNDALNQLQLHNFSSRIRWLMPSIERNGRRRSPVAACVSTVLFRHFGAHAATDVDGVSPGSGCLAMRCFRCNSCSARFRQRNSQCKHCCDEYDYCSQCNAECWCVACLPIVNDKASNNSQATALSDCYYY